jgi:C4-dicarboxylate-specific signal transduction histidine kinase
MERIEPGKLFARLPIRGKLIVLHNVFFLVLTLSLYFALRAPLSRLAERSAAQEAELVAQLFEAAPDALRHVNSDHFRLAEGTAAELNLPPAAREWAGRRPGAVWREPAPDNSTSPALRLARFDAASGRWQAVSVNTRRYEQLMRQGQVRLAFALALVYALAVLALELFLLPRYVYHPIRRLLRADEALRDGARAHELVEARHISGDELGQIAASRNSTITLLRQHERQLTEALARLEETTNDLRRKNHLLETAKQNLASQERLVSLGLMSAGVAHEINTPLAVLHGSIEKMIETPAEAANGERLSRMLRVTERLRGISESLTDFARARTQTMGVVRVKPLLEEAWSLVKMDAHPLNKDGERGVRFVDEAGEADAVVGNAGRLLQVFVNLFRNGADAVKDAIKDAAKSGGAAEGGGELRVRTRRVREDGRNWLVITVEDTGAGIRPDILPRIFEPFVTSRLDARGTGLGLAVTEGIIDQHGGVIVAANRGEGGARFEVTLPAPEATECESRLQQE